MKKIQVMLAALVALMSANAAMATDLGAGPNTFTMLDCTQLANDINIVISKNVVGGLDCTTDTVIIGLSVCHLTGLTTERSFSVAPTDVAGTPTCPQGALNADQTACEGITTGSAYPTATTASGTVNSQYPGNNCSAANAGNIATAAVETAVAAQ